jgi:tRNA A37 threonylcarbamoyladenosine dehydratase
MQKYCGCILSVDEKARAGKHNARCQAVPLAANPPPSAALYPQSAFFQRLALITGVEALEKLACTNVLVFGLGGVGSWCAEALVRSGVGKIGIVDFDTVSASNINRQVQATSRTIGLSKAEVLKQRLLEINPGCEVTAWEKVFSQETAAGFGIEKADYVIDAIDSLPHKLDLIEAVYAAGVKLFSSMGMARKIDPGRIKTASIWKTRDCPLARLVRQGLHGRGFGGDFAAVYSDEKLERYGETAATDGAEGGFDSVREPYPLCKKTVNGSAVTVTATAGMTLAALVLRDITGLL